MFDEEPDGDPHGECAAEIGNLRAALSLAVRQNEHDMLMTGEELRLCQSALAGQRDDRAREWIESEDSMRGAPLHEVLRSASATVIWHRSKPDTTNPVWEVIGQ